MMGTRSESEKGIYAQYSLEFKTWEIPRLLELLGLLFEFGKSQLGIGKLLEIIIIIIIW